MAEKCLLFKILLAAVCVEFFRSALRSVECLAWKRAHQAFAAEELGCGKGFPQELRKGWLAGGQDLCRAWTSQAGKPVWTLPTWFQTWGCSLPLPGAAQSRGPFLLHHTHLLITTLPGLKQDLPPYNHLAKPVSKNESRSLLGSSSPSTFQAALLLSFPAFLPSDDVSQLFCLKLRAATFFLDRKRQRHLLLPLSHKGPQKEL